MLKLLVVCAASLMGFWGWWSYPRVRSLYWSVPGLLLIGLGGCYVLSALTTDVVSKPFAIVSAALYCGSVLFVGASVAQLGGRQVLYCLWIGIMCFIVGGFLLYLVSPEKTKFIEVMDLTNLIERYGGLGHPNTLGRFAAIAMVMVVGCVIQGRMSPRWLIPSIPFYLAVILATMSRTPIVASMAAIGFMSLSLMTRNRILILIMGVSMGTVFGILAIQFSSSVQSLTNRALGKLTKTGDIEEVTTLTGRTDIWSLAWELTMEKPILGHGPGATPILMEKRSGHAHNVVLDVAANLGVPAAMMVLTLFLWELSVAFRIREQVFRGCIVFLSTAGLTERLLFGNIPESLTYIWIALAFWGLRLVREEEEGQKVIQSWRNSVAMKKQEPRVETNR